MSDDPEPDPSGGAGNAGVDGPIGELPEPDEREVIGDGSGGILVERLGGSTEGAGEGRRRVVAEKSIDEVFERFEEDSPEEVMAAADEPDPRSGDEIVEGDVDRLLGNLPSVPEVGDGDPDDGDLFDERDGHKRVVGESSVDEIFERFVEDDPEEVIDAEDPALESPTEAELRSLGGGDPLGELPDPPSDAPDRRGDPEGLERTGEDTHRSVGDSDVDAAFEEFEEDTVEEVIASAETAPEDDEMVREGGAVAGSEVDAGVEGLFGDIVEVDLETRPVPEADDGSPAPPPSPEETAAAVEGLLTDLSEVDLASESASDGGPSPQETAAAIEGLLADLSTVEGSRPGTPMTDETAEPSEPAFGPDDSPDDLGVGGDDVTAGVAVNRTPADGVVDVSATDLLCAFDGDGPVDLPEELPVAGGWADAGGPRPGDVTAAATFAALRDRIEAVPAAVSGSGGDGGATGSDRVPGTATAGGGPSTAGGDVSAGDDDDRGAVPEIELSAPDAPREDGAASGAAEGSPTASGAAPAATDDTRTGTMAETGNSTADGAPTDAEASGGGEQGATGGVEDLFAGYEEDTPEEVIARAGAATGRDEPDEAIVGDVEGLFADLSDVDLEPGAGASDGRATADDGVDRAPDSAAAVEEVEEMFSDLESVDVRPAPVGPDEPTGGDDATGAQAPGDAGDAAGRAGSAEPGTPFDVDIERPRAETDAIPGERDVDAVFEEFEEETVDEVIQVDDEPAAEPAGTARTEGDGPAEVETGDFMKQLAAGKDPEEIGIAVYDGSRSDDGAAIADGASTDGPTDAGDPEGDGGPSIEAPSPSAGDGSPSIEAPSPSAGDGSPSIERPTAGTGGEKVERSGPAGTGSDGDGDRTPNDGRSTGREDRTGAPSIEDPSVSSGRSGSGDVGVSATDLFETMGGEDGTADDTDATASGRSASGPGPETGDRSETRPPAPGGTTDRGAGAGSGSGSEEDAGGSAPAEPGRADDGRSGGGSGTDDRWSDPDRFTASSSGPGSETLFPAGNESERDGQSQNGTRGEETPDTEEGTVGEALALLVRRIASRLRDLF